VPRTMPTISRVVLAVMLMGTPVEGLDQTRG
jgi:hypothetical protein